MIRKWMRALALASVAACGTPEPEWTRERQATVTTRAFPGRSPAQIVRAAENVLKLADGSDVSFEYRPDGFTARRDAAVYFVIGGQTGNYQFDLTARGSTAELRIYSNTNAITASGVFPAGGVLQKIDSPYRLFFARMEHLLGLSDSWMTCDDARADPTMPNHGYEALCLAATDRAP